MSDNVVLALLAIFVVFVGVVDGRVYYLNNLDEGSRNADALRPVYNNFEQSSRDLDLAFSAGDPAENVGVARPRKKVYTLVSPDSPFVEINKEIERPVAYYRLSEIPERMNYVDDAVFVPEKNRKLLKIDGGNNKGEVILELRVIANHDSA